MACSSQGTASENSICECQVWSDIHEILSKDCPNPEVQSEPQNTPCILENWSPEGNATYQELLPAPLHQPDFQLDEIFLEPSTFALEDALNFDQNNFTAEDDITYDQTQNQASGSEINQEFLGVPGPSQTSEPSPGTSTSSTPSPSESESNPDSSGRSRQPNKFSILVWLLMLLHNKEHYGVLIEWADEENYSFKILDRYKVARMWFTRKNKRKQVDKKDGPNNMAKTIRTHYLSGDVNPVPQHSVYRFSREFVEKWRNENSIETESASGQNTNQPETKKTKRSD